LGCVGVRLPLEFSMLGLVLGAILEDRDIAVDLKERLKTEDRKVAG
jgi:hypothetical protein